MALLTVRAAADRMGVGYSTLKQWIHRGKIRTTTTAGGNHGLSEAEVDLLLTDIAANGIALAPAQAAKPRLRRSDEHLRELLAAGQPALLVTGDQRLVDEPFEGARVLTARAFAELVDE